MTIRQSLLSAFLFLIIALLMVLGLQPTESARAGLSLGFTAPLEHPMMLVMLALVGISSALLPREGLLLLPISFTLMLLVGGAIMLNIGLYPALQYFILGAILCEALLVGIADEKLTVLMLLILASLGFQLGGFYMVQVPSIAAPMYYLIGVLVSLSMVLAIAVAFGVTLIGDNEALWDRIKDSPRIIFLRKIFL